MNFNSNSTPLPGVALGASVPTYSTPSKHNMTSSPLVIPDFAIAFADDPENCTRTWPLILRKRKSGSASRKATEPVRELYGHVRVTTALTDLEADAGSKGVSWAIGICVVASNIDIVVEFGIPFAAAIVSAIVKWRISASNTDHRGASIAFPQWYINEPYRILLRE